MRPASLSSPVAVPEDGYFALGALQQAADVFLMGEDYHQCYSNGKHAVDVILYIKDHKYEYRESNAGENGTERYESGEIQHE